jgi:hypothetical protein
MNAIFANYTEKIMEVFMDDFSVYGTSFDNCLYNLKKVYQCARTNIQYWTRRSATSWSLNVLF